VAQLSDVLDILLKKNKSLIFNTKKTNISFLGKVCDKYFSITWRYEAAK